MQRTLLIILIALTAAVTAAAQTVRYPYMAFEKNDGTVVAVAVDGLVMHFADGCLVAENPTAKISVPLSQLRAKYFTQQAGVADVYAGAPGVEVYSVDGIYKGCFATAEAARKALAPGIYLWRSAGKTLKIELK